MRADTKDTSSPSPALAPAELEPLCRCRRWKRLPEAGAGLMQTPAQVCVCYWKPAISSVISGHASKRSWSFWEALIHAEACRGRDRGAALC